MTHIRGNDIRRMHQRRYTIRLIGEAVCNQIIAPGDAEVGEDLAKAVGDKNSIGSGDTGVSEFGRSGVEGLGSAVSHKKTKNCSDEGAHVCCCYCTRKD